MRTSLFSYMFTNPENILTMDAPNPLSWNPTTEYGTVSPLVVSQGGDPTDQINQTMYVVAVRLWCNFADGLVFSYPVGVPTGVTTPQFALFEGPLFGPQVVPDNYIDAQFNTLNEWIPVEKPMPRNTGAPAPHGYPLVKLFAGASYFLTNSVATSYNTTPVLFAFQALISCSYK